MKYLKSIQYRLITSLAGSQVSDCCSFDQLLLLNPFKIIKFGLIAGDINPCHYAVGRMLALQSSPYFPRISLTFL